ncbi:ATP-binding protein [Micromonospora sp. NPDC049301]|uniref:ATP-binding protein n=1 Tax=Micromonospora sp. NPDC049301 TaxID=3155723 RepID=UPI00343FDA35
MSGPWPRAARCSHPSRACRSATRGGCPRIAARAVGREKKRQRQPERDRIDRMLADARDGASSVLLIHGDAGIGKTALLDHAVARASGMRVLRIDGLESETELAFAGLHQLFLPVMDLVDQLPGPQARALRAVFGLTDDTVRTGSSSAWRCSACCRRPPGRGRCSAWWTTCSGSTAHRWTRWRSPPAGCRSRASR